MENLHSEELVGLSGLLEGHPSPAALISSVQIGVVVVEQQMHKRGAES